nr:AraC family transcriptional regulator ligand-binding domain-containing protein [Marinicella sp. W31]MDC2877538.1 AraC family transcriptional regulator ligand-binding domain-containing protein [Marinicella sp. W31]
MVFKKKSSVALARFRGIGSLPDLVEEYNGERGLARMFHSVGLPLVVLQKPDTPIPVSLMSELFDVGARLLGDRTVGLIAGERTTHAGWGRWTDYGSQARNLEDGLRRLHATTWAHMSDFQMGLEPVGRGWVWRVIPPVRLDRVTQYTDHLIIPMLTFARIYLGRDWRPGWIEVNYPRDSAVHIIESYLGVALRCGGVVLPCHSHQKISSGNGLVHTRESLKPCLCGK